MTLSPKQTAAFGEKSHFRIASINLDLLRLKSFDQREYCKALNRLVMAVVVAQWLRNYRPGFNTQCLASFLTARYLDVRLFCLSASLYLQTLCKLWSHPKAYKGLLDICQAKCDGQIYISRNCHAGKTTRRHQRLFLTTLKTETIFKKSFFKNRPILENNRDNFVIKILKQVEKSNKTLNIICKVKKWQ